MQNVPFGPKGQVRGFMSFFGLTMVTLGIYQLVWWFSVSKEVNAFLGQERMSGAKLVFLTPLTCGIYMLMWQFGDGPKIINEIYQRAGIQAKAPFFVGPWQFQSALNRAWQSLP